MNDRFMKTVKLADMAIIVCSALQWLMTLIDSSIDFALIQH